MTRIRFIGAVAWVIAALVGLCVTAYVLLIAINWRDQPPAAAAIRLAKLYDERPVLPEQDNGFVFAMGFHVPADESPRQVGSRRVAWMEGATADSPLDPSLDPLPQPIEKPARDPLVQAFIDGCRPGSCTEAFESSDGVFDRWASSEEWLLPRYRELIAHPGWRESMYPLEAPLPAYARISDGQKLLLLRAKILADKKDLAGVKELLESDVRFWRKVLESADTLIGKMIATGALNRHFELGNLVLRELPPGTATNTLPEAWRVSISNSERSMLRCMAGESIFSSRMLSSVPNSTWTDEEVKWFQSVWIGLGKPFFQFQATQNDYAELYLRVAELLNVPLQQYEAAAAKVSKLGESHPGDFSAYNPAGRVLLRVKPDFGPYARRVGDLEGVRRAALVTVALRDAATPADRVGAALTASPIRNPYSGHPFEWDERHSTIVFIGLESGERGQHRMRY